MSYHLRSVLVGHTEDVRCSTVLPSHGDSTASSNDHQCHDIVVTGSRDTCVRVWACSEKDRNEYECISGPIQGHSDYVTALCSLESLENGAFVSGSRDTTLRVWRRKGGLEYQPDCLLTGHEYQVTGVASFRGNDGGVYVVSTSLDTSVRLWKLGGEGASCIEEKKDHEGPVLSICACSDGCFVTGSGDCTMRLWNLNNGTLSCATTMRGHTDTVRSVAHVPSIGFVSGSHDATLKLWTMDGQCLQSFEGHDALIYSVAVSNDGTLIASASEDCTVRVWNLNGECLDVIRHPGCVWTVAFLGNGDLASGCSDGVARIWSRDALRRASDDMIAAFEAQLEMYESKKTAKSGGDGEAGGEKLKLYNPTALQKPGTHDGQTIVVEEGANGVAYSWNENARDWERVGEVMVDGAGGGWDFSFDVDIADNQPKIKLQANVGDDAYEVADRFITQNNLPTSYKEQIVQFLITNTQGKVNINLDTSGTFVDPLTGGSAYMPGGSAQVPSAALPSLGTHDNVDPFTGSLGHSMSGKFPVKDYVYFSQPLSVENAMKKLRECNEVVSSQEAIDVDEWNALEGLMNQSAQDEIEYTSVASSTVNKILLWPKDMVFPLLDLFRAMLLSTSGRTVLKSFVEGVHQNPTHGTLGYVIEELVRDPQSGPGTIASLRVLANMFHPEMIPSLAAHIGYLVDLVASCKGCVKKGVQNAYTAFLLNVSVYFQKITNPPSDVSMKIASQAAEFIVACKDGQNQAALVHALLAIGTLRRESLIKPADMYRLFPQSILNEMIQLSGEVSTIAREIQSL